MGDLETLYFVHAGVNLSRQPCCTFFGLRLGRRKRQAMLFELEAEKYYLSAENTAELTQHINKADSYSHPRPQDVYT